MNTNGLLTGLTQMEQAEIHLTEMAAGMAIQALQLRLEGLNVRYKHAISQAVENVFLADNPLFPDQIGSALQKLRRSTADAISTAALEQARQIQADLQRGLSQEANRLYAFATSYDSVIGHVQHSLVDPTTRGEARSLAKRLEPIWENGREEVKANQFGTGFLASSLGVSALVKDLLVQALPAEVSHSDVESLRQQFQATAQAEIDRWWQTSRSGIEDGVAGYILSEFVHLQRELDGALDENWQSLSSLPESSFDSPLTAASRTLQNTVQVPSKPEARTQITNTPSPQDGNPPVETIPPRKGKDLEYMIALTPNEALQGATRILEIGGRRIEAEIPPLRPGARIRLTGAGEPGQNGGPPGDLYLIPHVPSRPK